VLETWKSIPEWDDLYQASNLGKIRSKSGHVLKGRNTRSGHLRVHLSRNGKVKDFYVHCLVLLTFVGHPEENQECRHLDGNPLNNNLSNLKWGSRSDNTLDSVKHGTFIGRSSIDIELVKVIKQRITISSFNRRKGRSGIETYQQIADSFGVKRSIVANIASGAAWKHIKALEP
jgi:hypothetical protein